MKAIKIIIILALVQQSASLWAQRYITKDGHISFYSEAPLENIEAHNHQALSIIDFEKQEIVVSLLMKGFEFEKSLMQEHFNENYVESDKFPKATLKGDFSTNETVALDKDGTYTINITGQLTIHGVTQPLNTPATIVVEGGKVSGEAKFQVKVADHDIGVPKVVAKNIAEAVEVTISFHYSPYNS